MNPLFQNASRAIRAALRQEFRAGELGRLISKVDRHFRGRAGAKKLISRTAKQIRRGLDPGRMEALRRGGLTGLDRYAKQQTDKHLLDIVFKSMGPWGHVIEALLRPKGRSLAPSLQREKDVAAEFLKAHGYGVIPPPGITADKAAHLKAVSEYAEHLGFKVVPNSVRVGPSPNIQNPAAKNKPLPGWAQRAHAQQAAPAKPEQTKQPPARKTIDMDLGDGRMRRIRLDDPLLTGEMIPVVSSNVHSIGFEINTHTPRIGTLKIRFLQSHGAQARGAKVPGATYEYYNVPTDLFRRFRTAASKGKWVWDNVRIRGTGDTKFDYKLAGINYGYVPRRHTWAREGLTYQKRSFLGQHRGTHETRLFHSADTALIRPWNGRPGGAAPNRGRPKRGR